MKLACQINSYAGDGTPLKTKYKFCYLELDIETRKGEITFKEFGEYSLLIVNLSWYWLETKLATASVSSLNPWRASER